MPKCARPEPEGPRLFKSEHSRGGCRRKVHNIYFLGAQDAHVVGPGSAQIGQPCAKEMVKEVLMVGVLRPSLKAALSKAEK